MSLMTLDEAIQHCRDKENCSQCGQEHKQLREWLEELKSKRNLKKKLYNCKKVILTAPKEFIPFNLDPQRYKEKILVDACLAQEIQRLWSLGIKTTGCCCGHGRVLGYIGVFDDYIEAMEALGYQHYIFEEIAGGIDRKDAFIPKTTHHIYEGYSDGFQG